MTMNQLWKSQNWDSLKWFWGFFKRESECGWELRSHENEKKEWLQIEKNRERNRLWWLFPAGFLITKISPILRKDIKRELPSATFKLLDTIFFTKNYFLSYPLFYNFNFFKKYIFRVFLLNLKIHFQNSSKNAFQKINKKF